MTRGKSNTALRPLQDSDSAAPKLVKCPTCSGPSPYSPGNTYRPFCSERCKNIDFGAWAGEDFRVPTENSPEDETFGNPRLQH
jgi:hypothetical protein